jgi:hypothetical protein
MTKREKIIVGIMLLTVGYGAIELLLPKPKGVAVQSVQSAEGLNAFISKVADTVKGATSETSDLVIAKAEAAWKQNPFIELRKTPEVQPASQAEKPAQKRTANLAYSGFIELGSKRLAIINGLEYEAGDRVDPGGLVIKSILPNKVIMSSSPGESTPVVLPLQETE